MQLDRTNAAVGSASDTPLDRVWIKPVSIILSGVGTPLYEGRHLLLILLS